MPIHARVLVASLFALSTLYVVWFARDADPVAEFVVFALPPLVLALTRWRGWRTAAFWASLLGLFWFSHGVMAAWSRPREAAFAWGEIVLSLVAIFSACWPGLQARFAKKAR